MTDASKERDPHSPEGIVLALAILASLTVARETKELQDEKWDAHGLETVRAFLRKRIPPTPVSLSEGRDRLQTLDQQQHANREILHWYVEALRILEDDPRIQIEADFEKAYAAEQNAEIRMVITLSELGSEPTLATLKISTGYGAENSEISVLIGDTVFERKFSHPEDFILWVLQEWLTDQVVAALRKLERK